ncbi:acetyl-CoA carboxylase [Sinorhizobium sp. BG8]|uniref:acetyl-CoA carboxylase n=1 Tax=Sinorhizobium sp. BG8 TaxID=2613773 RepID=UPI00193E9A0F|nr:acetyl-CoA carboxylase [Sinorhizobium sp. BG8]QRM57080.1 acetyl-CoA carboxylase [Sinorhizobium sp. BG8]
MSAIGLTDPVTIAALSDALTRAGVEGLEITTRDGHIRIVALTGGGAEVSHSKMAPVSSADTVVIKAPIAGYFRPVAVGTDEEARGIAQGEILGFMAVDPVLVPLVAPHSGLLRRQLVEPETLTGFGTPLFEIQKKS